MVSGSSAGCYEPSIAWLVRLEWAAHAPEGTEAWCLRGKALVLWPIPVNGTFWVITCQVIKLLLYFAM